MQSSVKIGQLKVGEQERHSTILTVLSSLRQRDTARKRREQQPSHGKKEKKWEKKEEKTGEGEENEEMEAICQEENQ